MIVLLILDLLCLTAVLLFWRLRRRVTDGTRTFSDEEMLRSGLGRLSLMRGVVCKLFYGAKTYRLRRKLSRKLTADKRGAVDSSLKIVSKTLRGRRVPFVKGCCRLRVMCDMLVEAYPEAQDRRLYSYLAPYLRIEEKPLAESMLSYCRFLRLLRLFRQDKARARAYLETLMRENTVREDSRGLTVLEEKLNDLASQSVPKAKTYALFAERAAELRALGLEDQFWVLRLSDLDCMCTIESFLALAKRLRADAVILLCGVEYFGEGRVYREETHGWIAQLAQFVFDGAIVPELNGAYRLAHCGAEADCAVVSVRGATTQVQRALALSGGADWTQTSVASTVGSLTLTERTVRSYRNYRMRRYELSNPTDESLDCKLKLIVSPSSEIGALRCVSKHGVTTDMIGKNGREYRSSDARYVAELVRAAGASCLMMTFALSLEPFGKAEFTVHESCKNEVRTDTETVRFSSTFPMLATRIRLIADETLSAYFQACQEVLLSAYWEAVAVGRFVTAESFCAAVCFDYDGTAILIQSGASFSRTESGTSLSRKECADVCCGNELRAQSGAASARAQRNDFFHPRGGIQEGCDALARLLRLIAVGHAVTKQGAARIRMQDYRADYQTVLSLTDHFGRLKIGDSAVLDIMWERALAVLFPYYPNKTTALRKLTAMRNQHERSKATFHLPETSVLADGTVERRPLTFCEAVVGYYGVLEEKLGFSMADGLVKLEPSTDAVSAVILDGRELRLVKGKRNAVATGGMRLYTNAFRPADFEDEEKIVVEYELSC